MKLRENIEKVGMSARAKVGLVAGAMIVGATNANAALDTTNFVLDTTDYFKVAGILLVAVGGLWGVRKVFNLTGK